MDFSKTEATDDLSALTESIAGAVSTSGRQRELDAEPHRFDRTLWRKLVESDIVSAAAPESLGGGGFGLPEQLAVLTALGAHLGAVPYLESVVLGAAALADSPSLADWGVAAVAGDRILTVALDGEPGDAPVRAVSDGDGVRLTGSRTQVGYAPLADGFLVPAAFDGQPEAPNAVFLVAPDDPGVTVTPLRTTGLGSIGEIELADVRLGRARRLASGGAGSPEALRTRAILGHSAYQLGVLERGLTLTAEYARERQQFDRPIGSFQAVSQRLADGYIDVKGLRLTLTQAGWRVAEGEPAEARDNGARDTAVATAGFWAAEAGHRVAHTIVHVHGGVGIDTDHPIHRYFLVAKQIEFTLGGATRQLLAIGRRLADTPA